MWVGHATNGILRSGYREIQSSFGAKCRSRGVELQSQPDYEDDRELFQLKLDYAWRWFALHARQRVNMFNYFLVASGILANAYGLLLREKMWGAAAVAAAVGCVIGLASMGLDARNRQLVKLGEDLLADLEERCFIASGSHAESVDSPNLGILAREARREESRFSLKHKFLIRSLEFLVAGAFLAAALYALCMR